MKTIFVDGEYIEVADSYGVVPITAEQRKKAITDAIQAHLDSEAQAKGYESILSACSYAGHTNPFQAEGQAFVAWRGEVWAYCYQALAEVMAGTRTEPTAEELLFELPTLVLPQ